METRTLIVGRLKGQKEKFIALLVSVQRGHILESSRALTEEELRELLAKNYGESEAQIQMRINLANENPAI